MKTIKEFLEDCPKELRPKEIVVKHNNQIMYWGSLENYYDINVVWRTSMEVLKVEKYYETYPFPGRKVLIEAITEDE